MGRCINGKTLSRYLDGDLAPAAAARVAAHLAECPACVRLLDEMRSADDAVRGEAAPAAAVPDVAARVTADLAGRGAFLAARVAAGKRRLFGELPVGRMAAATAAAAVIVAVGFVGLDRLTRDGWARRTAPVVADAERVLVRLVYVDAPQEAARLAWARDESRRLDLSARLAEARTGASPSLDSDLAYLQETFTRLSDGGLLPVEFLSRLSGGEALARAAQLRERLSAGG